MKDIKQQVTEIIKQEPSMLPAAIATQLEVSEFDVVRHLPSDMVTLVDGSQAEQIFESLAEFGPVTSIMHIAGSIFEVKAPFPKGKVAHGYYNLMGRNGQMEGHLKLENMANIALVSKPFRGAESHYFCFFDEQGNTIFKIYLGRDTKRQLFPGQVETFSRWKKTLAN